MQWFYFIVLFLVRLNSQKVFAEATGRRTKMDLCHLASVYENLTALNRSADFDIEENVTESYRLVLLNRVAYVYISSVVIAFGIVGDLMTIFILTHRSLRKSSVVYMYLTALAVTDLCTMLSVVPMILWLMDVRACSLAAAVYYAHIGFPLANAFMGASVWVVVFLTLCQYVAVCHPFYVGLRSRRICFYLTLLAYFISFVIYIPWGFKKTVYYTGAWWDGCAYIACDNPGVAAASWYQMYQWVREVISRFIPFVVVAFFNICILYTYRVSKRERLRRVNLVQKEALEEKSEKEEKRLWLLLVGIMCVFFVCTIPAAPLTILVSDRWSKNFPFQVVRAVINILEFTKFALNFYFYCMINPEIRRLAVARLMCLQLDRSRFGRNNFQLSTLMTTAPRNGGGRFLPNSRSIGSGETELFKDERADVLRSCSGESAGLVASTNYEIEERSLLKRNERS